MRRALLLCILAVAAGCAGETTPASDTPAEEPASLTMFAGLPILPGSHLAGETASAAEAVVQVPVPADSVASFYRSILMERRWTIRGDATALDGSVTLHAASPKGRPIWIVIRPAGPNTAQVSVIATAGAGADSAAPR